MKLGISRTLIQNTLGCACGIVGAYDAWWVIRYWGAIQSLYMEAIAWMRML